MNVLVLLAGIADPLRPLPSAPDVEALRRHAADYCAMSPFDEAALELALKLRDRDPAARIAVWTAGSEAMARKAAAYPVDPPVLLDGLPGAWDAGAWVAAVAALRGRAAAAPDLVLMGREFGDWDDGTIPALLSRAWALPYLGLAVSVEMEGAGAVVTRQGAGNLEQVRCALPLLASVTNAPSNRLRHPLMKNVMLAKKAQLPRLQVPAGAGGAVALEALRPAEPPPRAQDCEMLGGDVAAQAQALASRLLEMGR